MYDMECAPFMQPDKLDDSDDDIPTIATMSISVGHLFLYHLRKLEEEKFQLSRQLVVTQSNARNAQEETSRFQADNKNMMSKINHLQDQLKWVNKKLDAEIEKSSEEKRELHSKCRRLASLEIPNIGEAGEGENMGPSC